MSNLNQALSTLAPARLQGIRRGIEKESLRATNTGALAMTPHPAALGSALTHPNITTDYSESQLELITGVHASVEMMMSALPVCRFGMRVAPTVGTTSSATPRSLASSTATS